MAKCLQCKQEPEFRCLAPPLLGVEAHIHNCSAKVVEGRSPQMCSGVSETLHQVRCRATEEMPLALT